MVKTVSNQDVAAFLALKVIVEKQVERKTAKRKTAYMLYSENGFTPEQQVSLEAAGAMYSTSDKLTSYEAGLDASGK